MDSNEFKKQFLGEWKVDQRILDLEGRLTRYYSETMNCGNAEALKKWREFKNWCGGCYTQTEINNTKHNVLRKLNL